MNTGMVTGTGSCMYTTLAQQLRRAIEEREFLPGQLIGSEKELARRQGISRVTVRKASELLVNEGLIERRPGKGLYVRLNHHVTTQLVQVVVGDLRWEPCLQVASGVKMAAKAAGMQMQLYDAQGDEETDLEMIRQLPETSARGAVIVSFHSKLLNGELYALQAKGFPFVLVQQRLRDIEVPSVMVDNASGGYEVGRTLVEAGHRRIGFIGDLFADTVSERLAGLRDAMGDAGLPFDRSLVIDLLEEQNRLGDWSPRVEQCVNDVMGRTNPPTALFCSCDAVARSAYRALANLGLKVPDDVSIAGFDNDPLAEWLAPGLTTVRQPFREMGHAAIELLCRRIEDPNAAVEHRVMPVQLVQRGSVAAPPRLLSAK